MGIRATLPPVPKTSARTLVLRPADPFDLGHLHRNRRHRIAWNGLPSGLRAPPGGIPRCGASRADPRLRRRDGSPRCDGERHRV